MRRLPGCSLRIECAMPMNGSALILSPRIQDSPRMTADLKSSLVSSVQAAAEQAGLVMVSATEGSDFHGKPTAVFQLGSPDPGLAGRTLKPELREGVGVELPPL